MVWFLRHIWRRLRRDWERVELGVLSRGIHDLAIGRLDLYKFRLPGLFSRTCCVDTLMYKSTPARECIGPSGTDSVE